jgi:fructokinase
MSPLMRIGVDVGGTKIEALALDGDGTVRGRRRVPTPRDDYAATLETIARLVRELEAESGGGEAKVGVGMPGTLSPVTGLVKNANSTWLNGQAFAQDLARLVPRPLRFANDANCFALSEAVDGAGKGARVVFGAILGTGVGGGVVVDGRVLTGPNAIAGEWGHNPLPWPNGEERPGPPCYCGRTGCIETYLSGPGLSRDHARESGERADAVRIATEAAEGRAAAQASLARYEERLARALASVVNLLDPDVIVLGGGLSHIDQLYTQVPRLWRNHVFSDRVDTVLARPHHGDASGVRGAAWLWTPGEPVCLT